MPAHSRRPLVVPYTSGHLHTPAMTDRKLFWGWVRWLRKRWPVSIPVKVKLAPKSKRWVGDQGWTYSHYLDNRLVRATVYINDAMHWETTQSTLWHEWAHVLRSHIPAGELDGDAADRCPIFGATEQQIQTSWRIDRGQADVR